MSTLTNRIVESRNKLLASYDRVIDVLGRIKFTRLNTTTPTTLPTSATITASPNPPSIGGQTTYTVTTNNSWTGTLYISYFQDAASGTGAGGTVPVAYNKSVAINNGTGNVSFALPFPESVSSYNTLYVKVYTTDGQNAVMGGTAIGSAVFTLQGTATSPVPTSASISASPSTPNITGNTTYTVRTSTSWSGTLYLSYFQDAAAGTGAGGTVPVSFNKSVAINNGTGSVSFALPFPESVSSYNTLYVRVFTTSGQSATVSGGAIGSAVFNLVSSVARTLRISNVAPDPLPLSGNVSFNISSTGLANGTQVNWAINYLFRNSFIDDTAIYHNSVVTGTSTINNGSVYVSTPYPARNTGGKLQGYLNIKATTSNGSGGLIYSDDVNAGATFNMGGSSGSGTVNLYTTADINGNVKQDTFDTDEVTHVWVETTTSLTNVVVTVSNTWVKFQQADNTTNISPGKTYLGLALVAPSTPSSVVSVVTLTSSQLTKTVSFTTLSSIN